jgi:ubiquinone/menaquinone biosynthesis C-methylase UbiE
MQKADYSKIAPNYDKGRWLSEQNLANSLGFIKKYAKFLAGARLLDLGCGTGRFSIPIAEKLGCSVTGADMSAEMVAQARAKGTGNKVTWDIQDAHHLSYAEGSFDIVYMSHLLHHCTNPAQVLRDCYRVLKPEGVIIIRHCVIEEISEDPESTFFPEALEINKKRMTTLEEMLALVKGAGFTNVTSEIYLQISSANGHELYERMATRNVSALSMIPDKSFNTGLKHLKEYVEKHADDPWLTHDKLRITAGYK